MAAGESLEHNDVSPSPLFGQAPEPTGAAGPQDAAQLSQPPEQLHCTRTETVQPCHVMVAKAASDQLEKPAPLNMAQTGLDRTRLPPLARMHSMPGNGHETGDASKPGPGNLGPLQEEPRIRTMVGSTIHEPVALPWGSGAQDKLEGADDDSCHGSDAGKMFAPAFPVASAEACDETLGGEVLASDAKLTTTPPLDDGLPECHGRLKPRLDDAPARQFALGKSVAGEDGDDASGSRSAHEMPLDKRTPLKRKARLTSSSTTDEGEVDRSGKRIRKAAEVFGYVALGGVAVMSALIATAPKL